MGAGLILDHEYRKHVIEQIESDENYKRKQESLKRYEIYRGRLEPYVYNVLQRNLSSETLDQMRVISSINVTKRIVDEESSIYMKRPDRMVHNSDDKTDELVGNIYSICRVNTALKKANAMLNLQEQCCLQVVPKGGKLKVKVLQPHHYDVIPAADPEDAAVYILSQYDKDKLFDRVGNQNNHAPQPSAVEYRDDDRMNQSIGDAGDWMQSRGTYVWWSDLYHFSTDSDGNIINPETGVPFEGAFDERLILNPLGRKPFIDVKQDSDGEYWQRYANSTVDFAIDLALIISDIAETLRLQGFGQAVISATEPPVDMKIGPNTTLFLKKSKNADPGAQPQFEFVSPNPDLNGSIEVLNAMVSLFLTSKGQDAGTVTSEGASAQRFSSALDRLLASIEKFEASEDDFSLFKWVEAELFELFKDWLELFSGVSDGGLMSDLSGIIPEDVSFDVQFQKPNTEITDKEKYLYLMQKVDDGAMTMVELIMQDRDVDEDKAREILENIAEEKQNRMDDFIGNRESNPFGQESETDD